jgi:hypothetical protein
MHNIFLTLNNISGSILELSFGMDVSLGVLGILGKNGSKGQGHIIDMVLAPLWTELSFTSFLNSLIHLIEGSNGSTRG